MNELIQSLQTPGLVVVVGLLVGTACTAGTQAGGEPDDPNRITQADIEEVGEMSHAYNLVRRLHPTWLEKRGRNSLRHAGRILVYVDGSRRGGPESLKGINVIDVRSIQYLRPTEATMRYGSGHDHGAILVDLKGK